MSKKELLKNPWMDFASYGIKDASRFKGREEEIKKFLRIMDSGTMSVLYANSGIGKTSFLNAGISPIYQMMGFFPIHIVFPDEVFTLNDIESWLLQCVKDSFVKQDGGNTENHEITWESIIKTEIDECEHSLWWHLHTKAIKKLNTGETLYPLLIFDQFEEIFTKSKKYANSNIIQNFFKLVEQLASTSLPNEIEEELDKQDDKGNFIEIDSEHHYKVVFSLRKEYLSDFDYWTNDVNSISELHQNRMFLLPLKREQAIKVITQQPINENCTECYTTLNKVTDKILDLIDPKKKDEIEPFILSALCSKLYNKAVSENKEQLDSNDVDANISNIVLEIYEDKILTVFNNNIDHLKKFEDTLVDGDGHRNRPKVKELDDIQFVDNYQKKLEDEHIIRIDTYDDDTYIELIHDLLAKAINKKRENEQERRLIDLEKSFEKERKKKRYQTMISTLLGVVTFFVIWSLFFTKKEEQDQDSLYQICLKAVVNENVSDEKKFSPDDFWNVNLLFWTTKGKDTLRLENSLDSLNCNFHKGGDNSNILTITFTKKEIDSLEKIKVEVRPITTLCKNDSIVIDIKNHCYEPNIVDTIPISITKNTKETELYKGEVLGILEDNREFPLNEALIIIAGKETYTDTTGHYAISVPRVNALFNHIYIIKQGFCFVDTILENGITIKLKRDPAQNFNQKRKEIMSIWKIAHISNRKKETTEEERKIMKIFLLDDKKHLRRGMNDESNKDTLRFIYYDLGKLRNGNNDKADNIIAKVGDIRNIIGIYQDKKERKYIFEGSMTSIKPDSAEWSLDITQYDRNFNTRKRKAILSHANNPKKTKITFTK